MENKSEDLRIMKVRVAADLVLNCKDDTLIDAARQFLLKELKE